MGILKNLRRSIKCARWGLHPWFRQTLKSYKMLDKEHRFSVQSTDFFPCLKDRTRTTGFDTHYIYHPAWAARCVAKINPSLHIDISSYLAFSTIVSAFVKTDFYDFRPAEIILNNWDCKKADLTRLCFQDESVECLSCMHTVEHIGLGRYGDEVDPSGDIKAMSELKRVLKRGGNLLFVVPVGSSRIQFNAHRIYSYDMVLAQFQGLELVDFTLIPDNAAVTGLVHNASADLANSQKYGCGCFWFRKP